MPSLKPRLKRCSQDNVCVECGGRKGGGRSSHSPSPLLIFWPQKLAQCAPTKDNRYWEQLTISLTSGGHMAKKGKILISICEKLITRNRLQSCWGHSRVLCCLALSPLAPQQKRLRYTRQLTRNAWQVNGSIALTAAGLAQLLERWPAEVRLPGPHQYSGS